MPRKSGTSIGNRLTSMGADKLAKTKTKTKTVGGGDGGKGNRMASRKSLAMDPTLLDESSDASAGPDDADGDEHQHSLESKSRFASNKSSTTLKPSKAMEISPATRRSTRLSGEGLPSSPARPLAQTSNTSAPQKTVKSSTSTIVNTDPERRPASKKRKADAVSADLTHPTPPDTDVDIGGKSTMTHKKNQNGSERNDKRQKVAAHPPTISQGTIARVRPLVSMVTNIF